MRSDASLRSTPTSPTGVSLGAELRLKTELDRVARLAARVADAPIALLSLEGEEADLNGSFALPHIERDLEQLLPHLSEHHLASDAPLLLLGQPAPDSPLHGRPWEAAGVRACASVAVRGREGELLGCLTVVDPEARDWGEEELAGLTELAGVAAGIVEHAAHLEESRWLEDTIEIQGAYLDHLFEAAPEAIAVLDEQYRVIRINPQYTRTFGYKPEEAVGRPAAELIVPPDEIEMARELGIRAARGERVQQEVVRRRKDGSEIPVSLLCIPVRISRAQVGIYTIFRDLTSERDAAKALQRQDERFRSLTENAMDVVAVLTAGGNIDYVTPSVERVLGQTPVSLVGTSAFALLHPDDAPQMIARFTEVLRSGCKGTLVCRVRSQSGEWRILEVRARNMSEDPAVAGVVLNARDVTEERAATQTHERLSAFLQATPDCVAIFDPHGRALTVNRAFRELLDISPEAELGELTVADFFPREVTERLLQEGIPQATREGLWSAETFLEAHDGRRIPIAQMLLGLRSASGTLEFVATLARDITAQKEAESALRRSEAHFRSLIENALDIITVLDIEGRVLFASPAIKRVLGYEAEELLGNSIFDLVDPAQLDDLRETFARATSEREVVDPAEFRVRHRDGSYRVLESVSENLLEDPAVGGVVINSRDVTERRVAEEALRESQQQLLQAQKMEAVGRLAGGIAHDFNNLLTAIKGFSELLLLDFEHADPRRAFATEIQGAAGRASALTRQLLAFSRRQVLQPEVLDLNRTITELERMLERLVGEDLEIRCDLDPGLGRLKADPGQIEQVIMNLIVNARDAMPTGGAISIQTRNAVLGENDPQRPSFVTPGSYVMLEVQDQGSGMSREVQERVFEPFFTTKEQGKGTGLGLSTVYGIVKQSGGYVWVQSEEGEGATFRICLPRVDDQVTPRPPRESSGSRLEGSETVLVVEDELAVRVLVRRVLERMGYRVLEAANGAQALERLEQIDRPIDLLLTDVVMPGMSGRELADQLTRRDPELRVLYISGYTDEAIVHHGVLDSGVAFLEKPFTPEILLRRVREVIDGPATAHS